MQDIGSRGEGETRGGGGGGHTLRNVLAIARTCVADTSSELLRKAALPAAILSATAGLGSDRARSLPDTTEIQGEQRAWHDSQPLPRCKPRLPPFARQG